MKPTYKKLLTFFVMLIVTASLACYPQPPDKHLQTGAVYEWQEGQHRKQVQLLRVEEIQGDAVPIFLDLNYGTEVQFPGGVIAIMQPDAGRKELAAALNDIRPHTTFEQFPGIRSAFIIDTEPGLASLEFANILAANQSVQSASPNWQGEIIAYHQDPSPEPTGEPEPSPTPAVDRHGNTQATATVMQEGVRIPGTMPKEGDVDYFAIVVPEGEAGYYYAWLSPTDKSFQKGLYMRMQLVDERDRCLQRPCFEWAFARTYYLEEGTHILQVTPHWSMDTTREYSVLYRRVQRYGDGRRACAAIETKYSDKLYECQWHLNNTPQNGYFKTSDIVGSDINAEAAWDAGVLGSGVNVQVVDSGMDSNHEDITDNVNRAKNHNHLEGGQLGDRSNGNSVLNPHHHHGDQMVGLIAARDNNVGYRGVAPRATIYLHNAPELQDVVDVAYTVGRELHATSVASNSYNMAGNPRLLTLATIWREAIDEGITRGNGGKGISFFFTSAVINFQEHGVDTNASELTTHPGTIPVCGTGEHGTRMPSSGYGYSQWICAPGGSHAPTKFDHYIVESGATMSGSTAIAAGVGALVKSANRALTWRDVKVILAQSAQHADPGHPEWTTGAPHYGDPTKRYHYNPNYGFGVVDAGASVQLAKNWTNLPSAQNDSATRRKDIIITDRTEGQAPVVHTDSVKYKGNINFAEYVGLHIDLEHEASRDLKIELTSPSGVVTKIIAPVDTTYNTAFDGLYRFASAQHLGENPQGTWTLKVSDHIAGNSGTIREWSINILGHEGTNSVNNPATGQLSIKGAAYGGNTLEAHTTAIADEDGITNVAYVYQWRRHSDGNVSNITGANESSYTLQAEDVRKQISLTVEFADDLGNAEIVASDPTATIITEPPPAPSNVQTQVMSPTSVRISWSPPDDSAGESVSHYQVNWKTSSQTWEHAQILRTSDGGTTLLEITGLTPGVEHQFQVTAHNAGGAGTPSSEVSVVPQDIFSPQVTSVQVSHNRWTISYDEVLDEANVPQHELFTVTSNQQELEISEIRVKAHTVIITTTWSVSDNDATTLSYSPDLQGNDVTDVAQNGAAPLSDHPADNLTPAPIWTGDITIKADESYAPPIVGYSMHNDHGQISEDRFTIGGETYTVQLIMQVAKSVQISTTTGLPYDFVLQIDDQQFHGSQSLGSDSIWGTQYWWTTENDPWQHQATLQARITPVDPDGPPLPEREPIPPSARLDTFPQEHQGSEFSAQLMFSDPVNLNTNEIAQLLQVTGASILQIKDAHASFYRWIINLKPFSTGDVTIRLPVHDTCDRTPSICTAAGKPVHNGLEVTIPGPAMTAEFSSAPEQHDGKTAFTVWLRFSELLGSGANAPTSRSFTATAAIVAAVEQKTSDGASWSITLVPDGTGTVTLTTIDVADCTVKGAVCTKQDEPLLIQPSVSVPQQEKAQSEEPPPNQPTTGKPSITGTFIAGNRLSASLSDISDANGMTNSIMSYQWKRINSGNETDITGTTSATYNTEPNDAGQHLRVTVSFTDDDGYDEQATSDTVMIKPHLRAWFDTGNAPSAHNGSSAFTAHLHFSEDVTGLSYVTVRDHMMTVTNGVINKASRVTKGSNERWNIRVTPSGDQEVSISFTATTDCGDTDAICAEDGRLLTNGDNITIQGPS